ncbi:hypothetical protein C8A01DRAFT_21259 [Parachaetomium inaequale]|uniref:Rhodopsin domain-containing protein n=1 Tax=Parachaetomium inaequale TaxID=2588326 RepID=A0AAN6P6Z2_9PEZI|nr:hypothetical protein C8A01DRAFT_21259 [Parachaetomium inaequale]
MSGAAPPPGGWIDPTKAPLQQAAVLLVGPVTAFYILALAALGLRVWAKYIKKAQFRFSDYAVFTAALFGTGYLAICWIAVERGGIGYPIVQVAPPEQLLIRKLFFAAWLVQAYANSFVRLSILDFFVSVFSSSKGFCRVVYGFEAASVAYLVACTITWLATCQPFQYNWELGPDVPRHCGNLPMKFLLSAVFNLVLDLCILVLPMPVLWTLRLNTRKKIAISVVFGLGIFVCFATAWRTYHVVKFSRPENQMNFTVAVVEDALWSGLEITLGIVNACLPVMQPAVRRIVDIPFLRLVTFTTNRSLKHSKMSDGSSAPSYSYSRFLSWAQLGSSRDRSEAGTGIERKVDYSVDIEMGSAHPGMPLGMEKTGSTTRLVSRSRDAVTYHNPPTNYR